jgi:hypothetical protein
MMVLRRMTKREVEVGTSRETRQKCRATKYICYNNNTDFGRSQSNILTLMLILRVARCKRYVVISDPFCTTSTKLVFMNS